MTIKINGVEVKVGQIWKLRSSALVEITGVYRDGRSYPILTTANTYSEEGRYIAWEDSEYDLVSLYKDIEQQSSTTRRKYYDVIIAWAEGRDIQVKAACHVYGWEDFNHTNPDFESGAWEWRVKPSTITKKYRMALLEDNSVMAVDVTDASLDNLPGHDVFGFVKWVSDVVAVTIEV